MNTPATAKDAILQGVKYYFTGKSCRRGHISKRFSSNRKCLQCIKENIENNSSHVNELKRNYYYRNLSKISKSKRLYRSENSSKINNGTAIRRAIKLNRTPSWLTNDDKRIIKDMYGIASRVSKETGIKYHVDHVIPLQGELVSGLHIPINLQLLTAKANLTKGNYFAVN